MDRRGNCTWVFQLSEETMERLDACCCCCCCRQQWWWLVEPVGGPAPFCLSSLAAGHAPPPGTFRQTHGELLKQLEAQDGFYFFFSSAGGTGSSSLDSHTHTHTPMEGCCFFSPYVEALGSVSACPAEFDEFVYLSLTSLFLQTCRWTFFSFLLFSRV